MGDENQSHDADHTKPQLLRFDDAESGPLGVGSAVKDEADRAQRYLDIVATIVVSIDASECITLINRKGCQILGYEAHELVGKNWFDLCIPQRLRRDVRGVFAELMAGRVDPLEQHENPVVCRDGQERVIAWYNTVLTDDSGRIVGTLSSGVDITDRKRAEQALRESEDLFSQFMDFLPAAVFIKDAEGRTLYFNKHMRDTFGAGETWLRKSTVDIFPGRIGETMLKDDLEAVERGYMQREEEVHDRNGLPRIYHTQKFVIRRTGKPPLLGGIALDITEQKRARETLQSILRGTASETGERFFKLLVRHLAKAIDVRYCLVAEMGELPADLLRIRAFWNGQRIERVSGRSLAGSPCEHALQQGTCSCPSRARELFPNDPVLTRFNVESYFGVLLVASTGGPMGVLAVMDEKPITGGKAAQTETLVAIFAARAAAELERLRAEEKLRKTVVKLETEHRELHEKNIALGEILGHIEQEKREIRKRTREQVERTVMPFIRKARRAEGLVGQRDIDRLEETVSSLLGKRANDYQEALRVMTPREIDVVELIKVGKTSKEIAETLHLSPQTVHKHRESIRRKLKIKQKEISLSTYLKSE